MKIIIDTNLWISFMLGRKITTMRSLLTYPTLEIYVCRELLDEFYDDLDDTLKLIHLYGKYVVIRTQSKSEIRDKKDLYLLSLADTIKANYIVTGDKDLLVLEKHNHTKIVTITEFMKLL